jgi:hypothetical protein
MASSIVTAATLAYVPAPTTSATGGSSATATAGNAKAPTTGTSATSSAAVTITLSSNAQRLVAATNNLTALETGGTNLAGVWTADYAKAASIGLDQEPAADAEIAALPLSDPAHIAQATAAQAFVKATIASAPTSNFGKPVSAPNPFAGASTGTLAAIISDKAGLYTGYEKEAAVAEYQEQQNAWVNQYGPGNPSNDNAAGKAAYYAKCISVYNNLPSLIKASYPANYVQSITQLQQFYASGKDDNDLPSFFGNSSGGKSSVLTLLEGITKTSATSNSRSKATRA